MTTIRIKWTEDRNDDDHRKHFKHALTRYVRVGFVIWAERGWQAKSGKVHFATFMASTRKPPNDNGAPFTHCGKNSAKYPRAFKMVDGGGKPKVRITCLQCIHFIFGDLARTGRLPGCPSQSKE